MRLYCPLKSELPAAPEDGNAQMLLIPVAVAPEIADGSRQLLLGSNPGQVRGRGKSLYPAPAQVRHRISANQFSQTVELEQAGTCVFYRLQHTFMVL